MYIGQMILKDQSVYTPWFPRQADNAIFTWEIIQQFVGTDVDVMVYARNTDESGAGDDISPVSWGTDGSLRFHTFTGLKELVRFKVTGTGGSVAALYRFLTPTWFDDAN